MNEKDVRTLQRHTCQFINLLNDYIGKRRMVDPDFSEVEGLNLFELDEDYSYDIYGDTITIQWCVYYRCGDHECMQRSFPLSDLWDNGWEESLRRRQEVEKLEKEKEEQRIKEMKQRAQQAKEAKKIDEERKELARLQAKYGSA